MRQQQQKRIPTSAVLYQLNPTSHTPSSSQYLFVHVNDCENPTKTLCLDRIILTLVVVGRAIDTIQSPSSTQRECAIVRRVKSRARLAPRPDTDRLRRRGAVRRP